MLLLDIYKMKYGSDAKLTKERLEPLAEILTNIAKRKVPWTWINLRNIIKGYEGFVLTDQLQRACEVYASELDGQSYWQARMRDETIKVFNGTKAHHAWLDPNSKILKCARPECDIKFIKTWPGMKYCPRHRVK